MSTNLTNLWNAIQRNDTRAIATEMFSSAIPADTKEGNISREYFMARVNKTGSCWLWTGSLDRKGYGKAHFWNGERRRYRLAHRVSYEMFIGPLQHGMLVCHRCDTPGCVNPQHLFLGTSSDNVRDAVLKDRMPRAKLTVSQVQQIRSEIESGIGYDELAERFGVRAENIRRIHKRENWAYLAEPQQPMCRYPDLVEGSSPCADTGTAGVSDSYPVTCEPRFYDAASQLLESEPHLFTHDNADELGHVIQQWIEETRNNWEPK